MKKSPSIETKTKDPIFSSEMVIIFVLLLDEWLNIL